MWYYSLFSKEPSVLGIKNQNQETDQFRVFQEKIRIKEPTGSRHFKKKSETKKRPVNSEYFKTLKELIVYSGIFSKFFDI
jgi:hypothetical protein